MSGGSRQPLRAPKKPLKTPTAADSDHKPLAAAERSPKLQGHRRSPRGVSSSDPSNQKKLGNRVADLESQLGQAQGQLKILKHQLASTAKIRRLPIKPKNPVPLNEEGSDESQPETDVFEVPVETKMETKMDEKDSEITSLKAEIDEKDSEMETKMDDLNSDMALVTIRETDMSSKMNQLSEELEQSKSLEAQLKANLERLEAEKNAMETEMKMMRLHMEQWRKAAEAAAIVLSQEAAETYGARGIETIIADDDGFAGGKKKGSGIGMFGEMWKKKGQK